MAASGFAIGLGNIWRFPYIAGNNGGGAFLLIYLLIVLVIGVPLFYAEAGLGRKAQAGAITGMRKLAGKGSPWVSIGWLGTLAALLIMSYYLMIMGWLFAYFFNIGIGTFQGITSEQAAVIYEDLISNPLAVLGYSIIPTLLLGIIVSKGVKDGIEKFVKTVMPLLFVMLICLAVFSLSLPGSFEGVVWYLKPDFSQINANTVLAALGQAFFFDWHWLGISLYLWQLFKASWFKLGERWCLGHFAGHVYCLFVRIGNFSSPFCFSNGTQFGTRAAFFNDTDVA